MFIVIYSMHYLCMYLSVCLAHSSTQTVFKSWRFHGPLLWTLIFSYFHRFSIGFKSGDWLGHSSSFTFFLWNQLRVSLDVCLGSLSRWNVHPHFIFIILVDGSRFLSRISRYIFPFILPSTIWIFASAIPWCFWGDVQCHLTSKHGVYYGIQRVQFLSHLTRLYSPSISQVCLNVVQ